MDAKGAWQAVLGQLQLEMAKATFDTWVRDAAFVAFEDGSYIIGVKNAYARDWLGEPPDQYGHPLADWVAGSYC